MLRPPRAPQIQPTARCTTRVRDLWELGAMDHARANLVTHATVSPRTEGSLLLASDLAMGCLGASSQPCREIVFASESSRSNSSSVIALRWWRPTPKPATPPSPHDPSTRTPPRLDTLPPRNMEKAAQAQAPRVDARAMLACRRAGKLTAHFSIRQRRASHQQVTCMPLARARFAHGYARLRRCSMACVKEHHACACECPAPFRGPTRCDLVSLARCSRAARCSGSSRAPLARHSRAARTERCRSRGNALAS